MARLVRILSVFLTACTMSVTLSGVARAIPDTVYLWTGTLSDCMNIGSTGMANNVFDSFTCKNGVGGYSLLVDPSSSFLTNAPVETFTTQWACGLVGTNGTSNGAWTSYSCQLGIAGWTLLVNR